MPGTTVTNLISKMLYDRGWTDGELARRTGLSRPRINRLKNRRAQPSVREALLLSDALGVEVEQLFSLEQASEDLNMAIPLASFRPQSG